jgi:G3E family GTPase
MRIIDFACHLAGISLRLGNKSNFFKFYMQLSCILRCSSLFGVIVCHIKFMNKVPLILLTGFLGSGKTTLLNGLLKKPALADSLVLINELGEIALDHHLVETSSNNVEVMDNGCLCCTVIGALAGTLRGLYWQRHDKKIPHFERIILETTGLADPAPILHELLKHPTILHDYQLAGVVTCVDAMFGMEQLASQPEALKQVALADVLLVTKADLVDPAQVNDLLARLTALNPFADIRVCAGDVAPDVILNNLAYNPNGKSLDAQRWLKAESYRPVPSSQQSGKSGKTGLGVLKPNAASSTSPPVKRHDADVQTLSMTFDQPLNLGRLLTALHAIAKQGGANLLRMKGILDLEGKDRPTVVHGVQHKIFPMTTLAGWSGELEERRQSRLVFIVRGMPLAVITDALVELVPQERAQLEAST